MATHCSILAWKIQGTEEPGGLQSMGSHESDRTEQLNKQKKREYILTVTPHIFYDNEFHTFHGGKFRKVSP